MVLDFGVEKLVRLNDSRLVNRILGTLIIIEIPWRCCDFKFVALMCCECLFDELSILWVLFLGAFWYLL